MRKRLKVKWTRKHVLCWTVVLLWCALFSASLRRWRRRPQRRKYFQHKRDIDDAEADRIINTYLSHRAKGMTVAEVTKKVFNVHLPNLPPSRPHTYPFITRNTYMAFADVVILEDPKYGRFKNHRLKQWPVNRQFRDGDVVYMKADNVEPFVKKILPRLETRFVLITHFSDLNVPDRESHYRLLRSPLLIHWFARNVIRHHKKITPIPIGLGHWEQDDFSFEKLLPHIPPMYSPDLNQTVKDLRPRLVHSNFDLNHNQEERKAAKKMFFRVAKSWKSEKVPQPEYDAGVARTKFVVSPAGAGLDCFRTYEALLLGAIPIVKNSTLFPIYAEIPALVLDDWWPPPVNKTALKRMLLGFRPRPGTGRRILMAQYWFNKINAVRRKALNKPLSEVLGRKNNF